MSTKDDSGFPSAADAVLASDRAVQLADAAVALCDLDTKFEAMGFNSEDRQTLFEPISVCLYAFSLRGAS